MNANQENLLASIRVHSRLIIGMISRTGAKAQRNDTLSVSAPLREEETFLDNYICHRKDWIPSYSWGALDEPSRE
jgi:hypothetical protein